jgi:hypothetical protein
MVSDLVVIAGMGLASFVYLVLIGIVACWGGKESLEAFLSSSKEIVLLVFQAGVPYIIETIPNNIMTGLKDLLKSFLVDFIKEILGGFLQGFVNATGALLTGLFTYRVYLVILFIGSVEFLLGWVYNFDRMKQMVQDTAKEVKDLVQETMKEGIVILRPLPDAIQAVFNVVSNPWRLLGYALFIILLRVQPELISELVKAAEKSKKIV